MGWGGLWRPLTRQKQSVWRWGQRQDRGGRGGCLQRASWVPGLLSSGSYPSLYMYEQLIMCLCVYVQFINTRGTYVYMYLYVYTCCLYLCGWMCVYVCIYVCLCMYSICHLYVSVRICVCVFMFVYIWICIHGMYFAYMLYIAFSLGVA